jgi:hypothetical protein
MAADSEREYPPCLKRLDGADRHPTCNDPMKVCFLRLIRPIDCRRCLGLESEPTGPETSDPPPPPAPAGVPTPPGLIRRAYSWAEAVARWTAAGQPTRPDKEVERIFNESCKTCKWFDPERQICRGCGCRVAENGVAVINKIKMATEHCPRELW